LHSFHHDSPSQISEFDASAKLTGGCILDNKFEVGLTYIKPTGLTPAISRLLAGIACRFQ
jgi:hypothetical protein